MSEDNKNKPEEDKFISSYANLIGGVIFLMVVAYLYSPNIDRFTLGGPEEFGQFGDYVGGILNPIIGLITVILVYKTFNSQKSIERNSSLEQCFAFERAAQNQIALLMSEKFRIQIVTKFDNEKSESKIITCNVLEIFHEAEYINNSHLLDGIEKEVELVPRLDRDRLEKYFSVIHSAKWIYRELENISIEIRNVSTSHAIRTIYQGRTVDYKRAYEVMDYLSKYYSMWYKAKSKSECFC